MIALQRAAGLGLAGLLALGCRNSDGTPAGQTLKLVASPVAGRACVGPDQVFTAPQVPTPVALATLVVDAQFSQLTAAGDAELLFATGANATVVQIDVSGGGAVETELTAPGEIAALLAGLGLPGPPALSGISVLDAGTLLAVEHGSNTIVAIDRLGALPPRVWAGAPNAIGGFADGPQVTPPGGPGARFHFDRACQLVVTGGPDPWVVVCDPGNHALRAINQGNVLTLAGTGAPFFHDGSLSSAGFDTPTGISLSCTGTLIVTELGAAGNGGHRVRQVILGQPSFFGLTGTVLTRVGDGVELTIGGDGEGASAAGPVAPFTTAGQDTYWIDSTTGVLRRMRGPLDTADCPLFPTCAMATGAGGSFTAGGSSSVAQTPGGVLFVLDAAAGALVRVTP